MPRNPIVVCFIGPDGSGKTTLSKFLYDAMKRESIYVSYTWWLQGENSLIRKILRKFRKSFKGSSTSRKSEKPLKLRLFKFIYPKIVLLDYLIFGFRNLVIPKLLSCYDMLIFDRFTYDPILYISAEFNYDLTTVKKLVEIYNTLLPNPDLIFVTDIPASVAYLRKREDFASIEDAEKIRNMYRRLYALLKETSNRRIVLLDTTKKEDLIKKKILEELSVILKK